MNLRKLHLRYLRVEKKLERVASSVRIGKNEGLMAVSAALSSVTVLAVQAASSIPDVEKITLQGELDKLTELASNLQQGMDNTEVALEFYTAWFQAHDLLATLYNIQGGPKLEPPETAARLLGLI